MTTIYVKRCSSLWHKRLVVYRECTKQGKWLATQERIVIDHVEGRVTKLYMCDDKWIEYSIGRQPSTVTEIGKGIIFEGETR